MKHFSRKTLHAASRTEATYYANHTARRYAARFNSYKLKNKAGWKHVAVQYRELRECGARFLPGSTSTWCSIAARHKAQHNPHYQEVQEQSRKRMAEHDQHHKAEVEAAAQEMLANLFVPPPV